MGLANAIHPLQEPGNGFKPKSKPPIQTTPVPCAGFPLPCSTHFRASWASAQALSQGKTRRACPCSKATSNLSLALHHPNMNLVRLRRPHVELLRMDEITPGMIRFPCKIPTNNGLPWFQSGAPTELAFFFSGACFVIALDASRAMVISV